MIIDLIVVGKTNIDFVNSAVAEYTKRLSRYVKFSIITIPDVKGAKSMSDNELKNREGESILAAVKSYDQVILLDENGKEFSSEAFAGFIDAQALRSTKSMAFVVGGAYGFSDDVYAKYKSKMSMSKMTFSHQMIRLIFIEQLYRAHTIIKGEPYHHK